jgi:hypothetical protein
MVVMSKFCESCGREFAPVAQEQRACNRMCGLRIRTAPKEAKLPPAPTRLEFLFGADVPACAGEDPELFFPEQGGGNGRAKEICYRCPLKDPCKAWAQAQNTYLIGIWGGTTWADRNRSKR